MKKIATLFFAILFSAGLLVGFWASFSFAIPTVPEEITPTVKLESRKLSVRANGQRSLLLVVVDELGKPKPELVSTWLILYVPENPKINFMPIFPTPLGKNPSFDEELYSLFQLTQRDGITRIDEAFLNKISGKNIWWGGNIIIDELGLEAIAESLQSPSNLYNLANSTWKSGTARIDLFENFESSLEKRLKLLYEEGYFYHQLCWESVRAPQPSDGGLPDSVSTLIPTHMVLDFDLVDFGTEFNLLRRHGKDLICEIPALGIPLQVNR